MKRVVGFKWVLAALLMGNPGSIIAAEVPAAPPAYHLLQYDSTWGFVVSPDAYVYQGGHVFKVTGEFVGDMPGPGSDIYSADNVWIGYLIP